MRNPEDFDEFYKDSRDRLLLQTFALTGDLRAARSAVRDAYVVAWHHWRKVQRQPDREAWLRPYAWADARRRHSARIWHRDRNLDPEIKATLDALGKLNHQQRRMLVLTQLSSASMPEIAREIGVTEEVAGQILQTATVSYALHRDSSTGQLRSELTGLSGAIRSARLPRSSIVRRAGATRRRAFTAVGVAASVVGLLSAGTFVTDNGGVSPTLGTESIVAPPRHAEPVELTLAAEQLLTPEQVARLAAGPWQTTQGGPNTQGNGINTPCQVSRFADPASAASMVRRFDHQAAAGRPQLRAVQMTELSLTHRTAASTYTTTLGWYAGCTTPGVRLLDAYAVSGVGERANLLVLERSAGKVTSTFTVGVARSGRLTTTVFTSVTDRRKAPVAEVRGLLSAAVNRLCGTPGAGTCAGAPAMTPTPPPPVGDSPGLLDVVDLPAPGDITKPWTSTAARRALTNLATPSCDGTVFHKAPMTGDITRSYLILKSGLAARFGITETVGTLPTATAARTFVRAVRTRMGKCEDKLLSSSVSELADRPGKAIQLTAWHIETEVSDEGTFDMLMAIFRRGNHVGQIGFVTARDASYSRATFLAVVERAIDRMAYLPRK